MLETTVETPGQNYTVRGIMPVIKDQITTLRRHNA
jgi:hypothetical protein